MEKRIIRMVTIILWLGLLVIIGLVAKSSTQGTVMTTHNMTFTTWLLQEVSEWVVFGSLAYVATLYVFTIISLDYLPISDNDE